MSAVPAGRNWQRRPPVEGASSPCHCQSNRTNYLDDADADGDDGSEDVPGGAETFVFPNQRGRGLARRRERTWTKRYSDYCRRKNTAAPGRWAWPEPANIDLSSPFSGSFFFFFFGTLSSFFTMLAVSID